MDADTPYTHRQDTPRSVKNIDKNLIFVDPSHADVYFPRHSFIEKGARRYGTTNDRHSGEHGQAGCEGCTAPRSQRELLIGDPAGTGVFF